MATEITKEIADLYAKRHAMRQALREEVYGGKPYANLGYWTREGMSLEEACDALTELVAATARLGPGDRVLEVGAGCGAGAVVYARRYQPASVIGIDVTEFRIKTGQDYVAQNGLADTIQLRLGDACALAFEPATFTKVLAIECAFHFNTRRDFFREAARVLTPGGRLALADIILRRGVDPTQYVTRAVPPCADTMPEVAANAYDADLCARYLREAGFDGVRVEPITHLTMYPFVEHLERRGRELAGTKGDYLLDFAARVRGRLEAGSEYVLVEAEKPAAVGP